jgi:hypothetical protein
MPVSDGLDHRAEDVADADAGSERAEADAQREGDRLAGVGAVFGCGEEEERGKHLRVILLVGTRRASPS